MSYTITGAGMICSVGENTDACFCAFCRGKSGNMPIKGFDKDKHATQWAYEIDDRGGLSRDDPFRSTKWLTKAINEAVKSAGVTASAGRIVIIIGTGLRELRSLELWWADGAAMELEELHFSRAVRRQARLSCPVMTVCNACSASLFALGLGEDMLALDQVDIAIIAGCDSITESMFGLLGRVNFNQPRKVQPFDKNRPGILMGEGAAALVIENPGSASARNAEVQGMLRGVGVSCDAYHETVPSPEGMLQAMKNAHSRAMIKPEDVDLLMVHGTGTILNDKAEAEALNILFGQNEKQPFACALKSMTGHTSGASGLMSVITALCCMKTGIIPATIGIEAPMEELSGFNLVLDENRKYTPQLCQVNAFGFGGVNAIAIVERGGE